MHKLVITTLLASWVAFVAASTMPSQAEVFATATTTDAGAEPTFSIAKRRRTFNCNQDDRLKKIEAQAWADAGAKAEIANEYDSGNQWQPAMNYWMGPDSTKSENFWKIRSALQNERNIHHPNWVFPEAAVDVYCGDTHPTRNNVCRKRPNPRDPGGPFVTQFASTSTERGAFYNTYNVLLCPRFFNEKTSLESILHDMSTGQKDATNASEYKFSWGHTIYHELMHLDPVIANEEVWDVAYGACPVAKLANLNACNYNPVYWNPPGWDSKHGNPHSLINADSWAFFASGVFFQKATQLKDPGRAINDYGIYTPETLTNFTYTGLEYDPEGIVLPTVDRADGTFDAQVPPDPALENTPPDDPPTPSVPYVVSNLPSDLATPFDAGAYFASYTPASVPSSSATAPPPAPTAQPPYAEGTCSFHMTYWRPIFWADGTNPYEIEIRILDDHKTTIGWLPHTQDDNRLTWNVNSRLEDPMQVTPEAQNDYVQFTIAQQSFKTNQHFNAGDVPSCSIGDWDCTDDPCYRQMDCSFVCKWNGGPSSDGGSSKINY